MKEKLKLKFLSNLRTNKTCEGNFKYMRLLAMIYMAFLMAATVMAYKIVNVWGIAEPGSTVIYTFTYFLGNIYAETYEEENANKLIWESIIVGYIFALLITVVNLLPSPEYWDNNEAYNLVLGHVLRFTNAGVIGYVLSMFLNKYLVLKWKHKLKGRYFWARSLLAASISEGFATFIAGIITFFGMLDIINVLSLMKNAYLFKLAYGLVAVWPASFIAYFLKRYEDNVER